MTVLHFLILPALLLTLGGPVYAQGSNVAFGAMRQDTGLPVEVSADNLTVDDNNNSAVFEGNVVIDQGEMKLSAPRVLVVYRTTQDGISRLEATGGVTLVSGPDAAEAERADYNIDDGTIVMSGNVLVTQGQSALSAEKMTVNLSDGTATMAGRVRTILQTGNN